MATVCMSLTKLSALFYVTDYPSFLLMLIFFLLTIASWGIMMLDICVCVCKVVIVLAVGNFQTILLYNGVHPVNTDEKKISKLM